MSLKKNVSSETYVKDEIANLDDFEHKSAKVKDEFRTFDHTFTIFLLGLFSSSNIRRGSLSKPRNEKEKY